MLNKLRMALVIFCAVLLAACAMEEGLQPIQSDPVYDKLGNVLCEADGSAATSTTAATAVPCEPGDEGCVGSVTVDGEVVPCDPPGDCSYISVTVPCPEPGGRGDSSSTTTSSRGTDPSSPTTGGGI